MSGAQPTLASVIEVSVSVTPPLCVPALVESLSWVPLPQATSATPKSADTALQTHRRNRVDLVIIGTLLLSDPTFGTAWRRLASFAPWKSPSVRGNCPARGPNAHGRAPTPPGDLAWPTHGRYLPGRCGTHAQGGRARDFPGREPRERAVEIVWGLVWSS